MGLTYSSVVLAEPAEVFAWHTRPGAITRLMPPWQPARVAREAPSVRDGRAVLILPGGLRWVAGHDPDAYQAGRQFADELLPPLGTALRWRHAHLFAPGSAGGTLMTDVVSTPVPAWALRSMFGYRHRQLAADLAAHARAAALCPRPLTIALTGSGGVVGTALAALLTTGGHRVIRLVRRPARDDDEREWRPDAPNPGLLAGADAVIHLAGAPIGGRFTPERKSEIWSSRIGPTRALAALAARSTGGIGAFVTASAAGFYGADRGDEILTEDSGRGEGFLADVAAAWEDAATPAAAAGIRSVQVRTGIVQTPRGGMLRLLRPLFAAGLGGPIGDGTGWLPWIEIDDLLDIYLRAVTDPAMAGPVNAVAPAQARNADYARTLGHVLGRPALVPVPATGPRLMLGAEGARELATASQRVQPAVLAAAGHPFRYPGLEGALRHVLGRDRDGEVPRRPPASVPGNRHARLKQHQSEDRRPSNEGAWLPRGRRAGDHMTAGDERWKG
ncbi:TIGR01777 family protein [Trebonia kvetii]|uniref:TIGR01777 family protein n=1 Tax=Trebonia kvetii TaxID=2480626 RepID=A0A6P2C1J2_9ACTN|nr:TIGR01777 family oxidoreductase [Trebonia kvetii]TVZ04817.1 TIGR01777 family protein [Trebonia kvetii]